MQQLSLIDRLFANLRAAGIGASEADLVGIEARGFLSRMADFERLVAGSSSAALPDYLDLTTLPAPPVMEIPPASAEELEFAPDTLLATAARLRSAELSPVALTEQALERLARRDPQLNAFQLVTAEQALVAAHHAEQDLAAGNYRGPLHGIPVAVKDLFDLAGYPTTAGSLIRAGVMATEDATAVARLRAAGALVIGKTRLSEFAYSPGSNNAHYGPTANPFDLSRDTGGSSSGSAAAVADGIVYAALGTDTGCSIRIPAAFCGLVGLKPTWGRVSLAGVVPLSWSLDHGGALARSVADAATMLAVLAGPDAADPRTLRPAPPFSLHGLSGGVAGLRVGLLQADGSGSPLAGPEQLGAMDQAAAALAEAGAEVFPLEVPQLDGLRVVGGAILAMEAATLHLPWLREHLDAYGEFLRQRLLAAFAYGSGAFVQAQQVRAELRRAVSASLHGVDVLLGPIHAGPVPALGVPASNTLAIPFNCLGWPALSQPVGRAADGLPLAVQLAAAPWCEMTLLRAALVIEQRLGRCLPLSVA